MNNKEQEIITEMIGIYHTYTYDWMGCRISSDNKLTYHHIVKRKDGETSISNGALLTKKSHQKLNKLLISDPLLYDNWQILFMKINRSNAPLNSDHLEMIREYRSMMGESLYTRKLKR